MEKFLMYRLVFLMGILLLVAGNNYALAESEILPILKDISIETAIDYDSKTGFYDYEFLITNPSINTGQISMVEIDILKPENSGFLNSDGLVVIVGKNRFGEIISRTFENEFNFVKSEINNELIPVGIKPPNGWSTGITVRGTVLWGSDEMNDRLMPGETLGGFEVSSRGVPAIRDMTIHPKWILMTDNVSYEDIEKAKTIKEQIAYHTKTIGPTAPPAELDPAAFIDNIIAMKHEAVELGWITNQGIIMGLDQKLEAAKQKLAGGQTKAAANILGAFIKEVEAQGCASHEDKCQGKHLTPEAYALLKYNAQYLVDNMQ